MSRRPDTSDREVGSPCVSICVMDPRLGVCIGCFRTLDEIADWINLDSPARLRVWDAIAERRRVAEAGAGSGIEAANEEHR